MLWSKIKPILLGCLAMFIVQVVFFAPPISAKDNPCIGKKTDSGFIRHDNCFVPDTYVNNLPGTPAGNHNSKVHNPYVESGSTLSFKAGYDVGNSQKKGTTENRIVMTWITVSI